MQTTPDIQRLDPGSDELHPLADEAQSQGYTYLDRMMSKAISDQTLFCQPGEGFFGSYENDVLIACGGLCRDPYTLHQVGRVRHLYVMSDMRRCGVGSRLVSAILAHGKSTFETFRLRTPDIAADQFYDALGFARTTQDHASHELHFRSAPG